MKAFITHIQELKAISAGSGIERFDGHWWVVGDDVEMIYKLDDKYRIVDEIPFKSEANNERLPKPTKPDLEMLSCFQHDGNEYLLAAGSGAVAKYREKGYLIKSGQNKICALDLEKLYISFRNALGFIEIGQLNLEGLCSNDELLFWLNRGGVDGKNAISEMKICDFIQFINEAKIPDIKVQEFQLKSIDGIKAGFSGCAYIESSDAILFCASAEDTSNSYDDGKVLGSYLGMISSKQYKEGSYQHIPIMESGDKHFKQKLESIAVKEADDKTMCLVGVCDNDDGITVLVEMKVE